MKVLNIIDLVFQTFVLGIALLLSLVSIFAGSFGSIGVVALYTGIFIGPWQMVSSLITTIARGLYFRLRLIHLVSSIVYIVGVIVVAILVESSSSQFEGPWRDVTAVFGFLVPAILAFFYYYITYKSFRLSRAKTQ